MILGAHESISGGFHNAIKDALEDKAEILQIFTKNSNRWEGKTITKEESTSFVDSIEKSGIQKVIAHTSYLINIASPNPTTYIKSKESLYEEILRCNLLKIEYLILHPGSHKGEGEKEGIKRISRAINEIYERTKGINVKILLENTAGQGNSIGDKFEHLKSIIDNIEDKDRIGICFDTCHAFVAGYKLNERKIYETIFLELENLIGLEKILAFHLNDSKKEAKSRIDRHENIGKGLIGLEFFKWLLNDERFKNKPAILETPPLNNSRGYKENLEILRSLISK